MSRVLKSLMKKRKTLAFKIVEADQDREINMMGDLCYIQTLLEETKFYTTNNRSRRLNRLKTINNNPKKFNSIYLGMVRKIMAID